MSFSYCDGRIWFRNYQIIETQENKSELSLVEVGPRFALDIIRVFDGSFGGKTLFENPHYVSPNVVWNNNKKVRRDENLEKSSKYASRVTQSKEYELKMMMASSLPVDPTSDVFR